MLLSRRNQLLLEFSFWNEPVPRPGPNIYELRSYQLRVTPKGMYHLPLIMHKYVKYNNLFSTPPFTFIFQPGTMIEWGNYWQVIFLYSIRKSSNWICFQKVSLRAHKLFHKCFCVCRTTIITVITI